MTLNLDRSFYVVFSRAGDTDIINERTVTDAMSLPQTVIDIAAGQISGIHYIVEMNPHEGWSRNVTEAVAEQIARIINADFDHDQTRPGGRIKTFVEKHCNIRIPRAA
jgi:hypothetical protein